MGGWCPCLVTQLCKFALEKELRRSKQTAMENASNASGRGGGGRLRARLAPVDRGEQV